MDSVSYEEFREHWLRDVEAENVSLAERSVRFAIKLFAQSRNIETSSADLHVCSALQSGRVALLYQEAGTEEDPTASTWYVVMSLYRTGIDKHDLITGNARSILDTFAADAVEYEKSCASALTSVKSCLNRRDDTTSARVVITVASDDPLTAGEKAAIDASRTEAQERFGSILDIEVITVESIYLNTLDDLAAVAARPIKVPLKASLTPSGGNLLIGAVTLPDFFGFLRQYRSETEDLDQLFEKNVRLYLGGRRRVNRGMQSTLVDDPAQFGLYNNGVTFVVKDFRLLPDGRYELVDPYIVNGCQTTRTIWEVFNQRMGGFDVNSRARDTGDWERRTGEGIVITKIVRLSGESDGLLQNITRFTNSQNAVSEKDFVTLDEGFQRWKREMAERYDVFLELQRGGWESRQALQVQNSTVHQFTSAANAFDLLKVYGAGWMREPGTAFARNAAFVPGGTLYRRILDPTAVEPFGVEDLYAAYRLQEAANAQGFGRGSPKASRRQTRFLFYFVFMEIVKDVLIRNSMNVSLKDLTRAVIRLFRINRRVDGAELVTETAASIIDEYLTQGEDDSVFLEPAFSQKFNNDLNAFLKWERLGKGEETPQFTNLIAIHKRTLGRGHPSPRDLIVEAIQ